MKVTIAALLCVTSIYAPFSRAETAQPHSTPPQAGTLSTRLGLTPEETWLARYKEASTLAEAQKLYQGFMGEYASRKELEQRGERLKGSSAIRFLNLAFIELSKRRLNEELKSIERGLSGPFEKPWMQEAEEKRMADKVAALKTMDAFQAKLNRTQLPEPALDWIHLSEMLQLATQQNLAKPTNAGLSTKTLKSLDSDRKRVKEAVSKLTWAPLAPFRTNEHEDLLGALPEIKQRAEQNGGSESGQALLAELSQLGALERQSGRMNALQKIVETEFKEDRSRSKEAREFLLKSGAKSGVAATDSVDLSGQFAAPQSQGHLFSCVAHALASDMSSHLPGAPSANYAYALLAWAQTLLEDALGAENVENGSLTRAEISAEANALSATENFPDNLREVWKKIAAAKGHQGPLHEFANKGILFELAEKVIRKNGLPLEKDYPSVGDDFIPASLQKIKDRKYVIEEIQRLRSGMTEAEMKQLLSNQKPFQIVIATDARYLREDWVIPDPHSGSIPHVFNVVGYGRDIDPNDNQEKFYFKIRDSFTPGGYHYKMASDALVPLGVEALRVTKVGTLAEPAKYEKMVLP
jgi:hypothetical protein